MFGHRAGRPDTSDAHRGAPTFSDATFQPEDDFGVWVLHARVWRAHPNGTYAQTNPLVSSGS